MTGDQKSNITSVFETLVDGVYIVDADYNIQFMNNVMLKDYGQGVGYKCCEVFHNKSEVCTWCKSKEVFEGKTIITEYYDKDLIKVFDIIEFPIINSDVTLSQASIFRDITKREGRLTPCVETDTINKKHFYKKKEYSDKKITNIPL